MSTQNPPHASGPPSPRQEHVPKRANPLCRTSDRFESWFRRFLMLVLVLGLPAAALGAGLTAYEASMRSVQAQAVERHEVTARLTSTVKGVTAEGKQRAAVRWTDDSGAVRTGTTLVRLGTPEGTSVRVWVDRDGGITGPPMSELAARTNGWFVAGMAAVGVVAGVYAASVGVRHVLDHGRYAQWDSEWDLVEPLWSARFRR
ncbi:Rv1733c family protein [Streptomyces sp. MN13]